MLGLDEHTGIILNFQERQCTVMGVSSVTLMGACTPEIYPSGSTFSFDMLGNFRLDTPAHGIRPEVWEMIQSAPPPLPAEETPPPLVLELTEQRQQARARKDWSAADDLRRQIAELGWLVTDTPEGPKLAKT
ncbi:MAG: hypothetical protein WHV44_10980 [Anaerolineales bacterium]